MAKNKKINLNTLDQTRKKKKDSIIFGIVILIFTVGVISIGNYFLDTNEQKVFKKRKNQELKNTDIVLTPDKDYKEAWAMSVENTLEKQNKILLSFMKNVERDRKEDKKELKELIKDNAKKQRDSLEDYKDELSKRIGYIENTLKENITRQNNKIEELKIKNNGTTLNINNSNPEEEIILGEDLLPKMNEKKEEDSDPKSNEEEILNSILGSENKPKETIKVKEHLPEVLQLESESALIEPEVKKIGLFTINTKEVKKYVLRERKKELREIQKRAKKTNSYHIMIGLTKAYLVSGVYAPAFSEGSSDPLPVLLQAEGNILIANNDQESVENCFFIGSAKGNMNSQTADIRLNRISCSLAGGTKKIEGAISGWVIGENGIPGVPGELLHRNGAWLAKTFVAGFLETFSNTLTAAAGRKNNVDVGQNLQDGLISSGAQSTSDVFNKIGDYYLKMAEQIFPIIEVKPGRTVDILLKGGETLTVTDFNSADISEIEEDIQELQYQIAEDEQKLERMKETEEFIQNEEGGVPTNGTTVRTKGHLPPKSRQNKTQEDDLFNEGGN